MATEGTFPKVDGDILYASEVNKFNNVTWYDLVLVNPVTIGQVTAILAHSATAWTAVDSTTSGRTTDSGSTWAACSTDNTNMKGVAKVCTADKTKAIACDYASGNISYSTDSGDNWTAASTDPLNITRVWDLSFPTAGVAVIACDYGTASSGVFYSTDGGDTWTASDFPAADCHAIDMIDGSNGIAIHSNKRIYTTADGGQTWTDSTQEVNNTFSNSSMVALTSTTGVMLSSSTVTTETFNTSTGGTQRMLLNDVSDEYVSNIVKTTDGNIYFAFYSFSDSATLSKGLQLFRSTDSGVTWSMRPLGLNQWETLTAMSTYDSKAQLIEYDTNKLLLSCANNQLLKIDVSA